MAAPVPPSPEAALQGNVEAAVSQLFDLACELGGRGLFAEAGRAAMGAKVIRTLYADLLVARGALAKQPERAKLEMVPPEAQGEGA